MKLRGSYRVTAGKLRRNCKEAGLLVEVRGYENPYGACLCAGCAKNQSNEPPDWRSDRVHVWALWVVET